MTDPRDPVGPDEIDLVDIFRFFWKHRLYLVGGSLAGCVAGFTLLTLFPGGFETAIPVTLDVSSLPAISLPAEVTKAFEETSSSANLSQKAFETLLTHDTVLASRLRDNGISTNGLAMMQSNAKPSARVLSVSSGSAGGDYTITLRLPVRGLGENPGASIVAAVNALNDGANSNIEIAEKSAAAATVAETKLALAAFGNSGFKEIQEAQTERMVLRIKLSGLEYTLLSRAPESMVRQFQQTIVGQILAAKSESGAVVDDSQTELQVSRTMRLLGALSESRKLSPEESKRALETLTQMQSALQRSEVTINSLYKPYQAFLKRLADAMQREKLPMEREKRFLPRFVVNEVLVAESVKSGLVETPRRKGSLGALAGLLLGGFVALVGCLAKQFVAANWKRIAEKEG